MKKFIITFIGAGLFLSANAQDMPEKKTQAGIILGAGMNFQKMDTKYMESAGMGGIYTIGANANVRLGSNIALCTGLEFDFSSWKYNSSNEKTYYRFEDTKILQFDESSNAPSYNTDENLSVAEAAVISDNIANGILIDTTETIYELKTRKHKMIYATVPLMFTFRTDYFGDFRYFGKFGLRTGFALSNKVDDQGGVVTDNNQGVLSTRSEENINMKSKNEVFFIKSAIGICGGAEWKFTNSTSLLFEVGFYYGITPLHVTLNSEAPDNNHLYTNKDIDKDGIYETNDYFNVKATQKQLLIKVGVLF